MAKRGVRLVFGLLFVAIARLGDGRRDHVLRGRRARQASPATPRWCCASTTTCTKCRATASCSSCSKATGRPACAPCSRHLRKAKTDPRVSGRARSCPPALQAPLWAKVQEVHDAILDFRKSGKQAIAYLEYAERARVLHRHRLRQIFLMPGASPRRQRPGDLRRVPARHARQDRRSIADILHIGDYKTAYNAFTEKGYTKAHREVDRVDDARPLRAARARHRRRAQEVGGRRPRAHRPGPVHARRGAARRPGGRPGLRGPDRRQGQAAGRQAVAARDGRLRARLAAIARPQSRPAHRGHLRHRRHQLGQAAASTRSRAP